MVAINRKNLYFHTIKEIFLFLILHDGCTEDIIRDKLLKESWYIFLSQRKVLFLGRCYHFIYMCQIFKTIQKSQSCKHHHLIRYANTNDRYLEELQGYFSNNFKGLCASQCRLSTGCLRLLSGSAKGRPGHEIITAISLIHLLINSPRCYLIEISTEINEIHQQIHLKIKVFKKINK